jgi:hypothetical protein
VPSAKDNVRVVRIPGLICTEESQRAAERHPVDEPDEQVRLAVEPGAERAELSLHDADVSRASLHQPDTDGAVQVEIGRVFVAHTLRIGRSEGRPRRPNP